MSKARREWAPAVRERLDEFATDVRYSLRSLRRDAVFSTFVVLTLSLGIGANAAMFGIVDKLLLSGPAHVRDASRVVRLYWTMRLPTGVDQTTIAPDTRVYPNLVAEAHAFSGLAMYTTAGRFARIGEGDATRLISQASATANLISVLGARLELGRFFTLEEQELAPPVVVLGYTLWRTEFGGNPHILNRTIKLSDRPYTVVGVVPEGFTGPELERVDVWVPLRAPLAAAARQWGNVHMSGPRMIARLKPRVTIEEANADATNAHRRTYSGTERQFATGRLFVGPLRYGPTGVESTEANISRWLAGVSAAVLLVACTNVVNLLLARAFRRRREMAVRLALGAGAGRLLRFLLTGSVVLALLGAAGGLAVAFVAGRLMRTVLLPGVDWTSGPVDGRVLAFSLLAAAAIGILIGVLPAWRAGRTDISAGLKANVRDGGGRRSVARHALTLAQSSVTMLLLIGAGLFVLSLERVRSVDLGIQPDRVVLVSPRWPPIPSQLSPADRAAEDQRRSFFARSVIDRLKADKRVEHAAATIGLPFGGSMSLSLRVPGWDSLPRLKGDDNFGPRISVVTPDYFATTGTRLLEGRAFTDADRAGSESVTIVSATMAAALWPGRSALNQCIEIVGGPVPCIRVIGIVQDVRRNAIHEDPLLQYYVPLGQETSNVVNGTQLIVRPRGEAGALLPWLRSLIREADPTVRYVDAIVLQDRVEPLTRTWRVGASILTVYAILALIVGAVGLFSVVAYLVEQRRHEIGVRIALGATSTNVVTLIVRDTLGVAAAGVALGAALALAAGRFAQPLLFDTSATEPIVYGPVGGLLLLVSVAASGLPALRARHVDPMTALRDE